MKFFVALVALIGTLLLPLGSGATEPSTDCVVQKFDSAITINTDASLRVQEDLTVDCGSLPGKHGIFRILPTRAPYPEGIYAETPVTLGSITNFEDQPLTYEESASRIDSTITWKIGDPDKTIMGVQQYRLTYRVDNAVYADESRQVFNWNLSGNFWQLPIDSFSALVELPIDKDKVEYTIYDGLRGSTEAKISQASWDTNSQGKDVLHIFTTDALLPENGVTLVAKFPSGTINTYSPTFLEQYGTWLWFILPLAVTFVLFSLWRRKGDDPNLKRPELVQYGPPAKLSPLELGLLESYGEIKPDYVTATMIDLAVRGHLRIEEIAKKGLFGKKDYQLVLLKADTSGLKSYQKFLLEKLFGAMAEGSTTKLSDNKNTFHTHLGELKDQGNKVLEGAQLLDPASLIWRGALITVGIVLIFIAFWSIATFSPGFMIAVGLSGVITLVFGVIMPRRTDRGAILLHELKGFKLYLSKAEKYRMEFYEKENIFEKYLPYAIAFALTDKWLAAFKKIYADQTTTAPMLGWYVGSAHAASFDSFNDSISSLSSQIGQTLGSTPGGSGGGFSGGGGGGGGGGSW
ncbi:MAG: DUF2207 domain-containing protein [Candidatus Berkelbacteria bacterium]|nr:MAG: DUF2207 domain-containing protein [Candidatus Berkelbacteria bacterium]QQG51561.1 MAG: DUF2207 domain-containing protein [Candidatus Berkelbacteria bacterium]